MENILELVTKFGLGIALAIVLAYLLGIIIKWMIGKLSSQIDENHRSVTDQLTNNYNIAVKLIERINRLDDDVSGMAGKMNYQRREMREGE